MLVKHGGGPVRLGGADEVVQTASHNWDARSTAVAILEDFEQEASRTTLRCA